MVRRVALLTLVIGLASAGVAQASPGSIQQKPGLDGCTNENGLQGRCADGIAIGNKDLAVSPDGRNVYSVGTTGLTVFDRNLATGVLAQKTEPTGCFTNDPFYGNRCTSFLPNRNRPITGVAVSPTGTSVHIVADGAISNFRRDTTSGGLSQSGTASCATYYESACRDARALDGAADVVVSPSGERVYVASSISSSVAIFDRDESTGGVTQSPGLGGCVARNANENCRVAGPLAGASTIQIAPDGEYTYVGASSNRETGNGRGTDNISVFSGPGLETVGSAKACVTRKRSDFCARGTSSVDDLALSPDGRFAYAVLNWPNNATEGEGLVALARNRRTGALEQLPGAGGCVAQRPADNRCARGRLMGQPRALAVSPDGQNIYVATSGRVGGIAVFDRNPQTGAIEQKTSSGEGCVWNRPFEGSCLSGFGLSDPTGIVVDPGGDNVYASVENDNAVTSFDRD